MRSLFFVGGCNRALPYFPTANGAGIASFWIDSASGECSAGPVSDGGDNPTFVAFRRERQILCATTEVPDRTRGTVSAYKVDPGSGELALINRQPTHGDTAAQVSFDRTGRFAAVANYSGVPANDDSGCSVAVYRVGADGSLGDMVASARHEGSGPHPERQTQPHPHSVRWSPDNRFMVVADLGIDRLMVYRFEAATGAISLHRRFALPAGSGPRDVTFHPELPFAYVPLELSSHLASVAFDARSGDFRLLHVEVTVAATGEPRNACSAAKLAPDGRRVFVGNRGDDSIARLGIDLATGIARLEKTYPSGGRTPRDFAFDPSGRLMVVTNQDSDRLSVFHYDADSGELSPLGTGVACGTPTAIAFAG